MTKEVIVKITGSEYGVSDQEKVEEVVKGDYYQKGGKHFVIYDVVEEEEKIHTTLKIEEEQFEIIKNGSTGRVHMKFKQGEHFFTMYRTMAGVLEVEFDTKELVISPNEDSIAIKTVYEISMNSIKIGERKIQIKIEKTTK